MSGAPSSVAAAITASSVMSLTTLNAATPYRCVNAASRIFFVATTGTLGPPFSRRVRSREAILARPKIAEQDNSVLGRPQRRAGSVSFAFNLSPSLPSGLDRFGTDRSAGVHERDEADVRPATGRAASSRVCCPRAPGAGIAWFLAQIMSLPTRHHFRSSRLCALGALLLALTAVSEARAGWRAGTARAVITPEEPVWMVAYLHFQTADSTLQDLFV